MHWMTSQLGYCYRARQAEHWFCDVTIKNFLNQVISFICKTPKLDILIYNCKLSCLTFINKPLDYLQLDLFRLENPLILVHIILALHIDKGIIQQTLAWHINRISQMRPIQVKCLELRQNLF